MTHRNSRLISARSPRLPGMACLLVFCGIMSGCAAFRPIHGVPARYLPEEYRGFSRAGKKTIDLSLLKQTPPTNHLVDAGDVLGIYIEGVLGDRRLAPPVNIPLTNEVPPSFGFPIPVRDDGTISLPLVGSLKVRSLTIGEVEARVKEAYTRQKQYLNPENDRILVSLQRPRTYRVLVIRQEAGANAQNNQPGFLSIGELKRGTGQLVNLPAYRNDVLHALAQTGGLPGLDAENAIYVIRRRKTSNGWTPLPGNALPSQPTPLTSTTPGVKNKNLVVRAQSPAESMWSAPRGFTATTEFPFDSRRQQLLVRDSMPAGYDTDPRFMADPRVRTADYARSTSQPSEHVTQIQGQAAGNFAPQTYPHPPAAQPPMPSGAWGTPGQMPPYPVPADHGNAGDQAPVNWPTPTPIPEQTTSQFPPMHDPRHAQSWPHGDGPTFDGPQPSDPVPMTPEEFGWSLAEGELDGRRIIKIPIRLGPGETVDLQEQDIVLEDGDIVFIESRDSEVFYTGGLLSGGQYPLPRDYDLNVLQAIAVSQARLGGGGGGSRATSSIGGQSALNNDVSISASSLIILRYLPDGRMVPIEVDLYQARMDVAEQIIIQPGDYILLQYRPLEAVAAFFERHLLEGAIFGLASAQLNRGGGN